MKKNKFIINIVKLFHYSFALPVALLIYILTPLIKIRFCMLISSRIGHFSADTELMLREIEEGVLENGAVNIYYLSDFVCNNYLCEMWRRNIIIAPHCLSSFVTRIHRVLQLMGHKPSAVQERINSDRDMHGIYKKYPPLLQFSNEERKKGDSLLWQQFGITENAKIVCVAVRDQEYLLSTPTNGRFGVPQKELESTHTYRNNDIETYRKSIDWLIEQGYFVFRMGVKAKSFNYSHERFIDISTLPVRDDFLDLFIINRACFMISTGTGIDCVASIFRKPILYTNYAPINDLFITIPSVMTTFALYKDVSSGAYYKFTEIFSNKNFLELKTTQGFCDAGIELIKNTPEELLFATQDMVNHLKGVTYTREDLLFQEAFWKKYPFRDNKDNKDNLDLIIAPSFIKKYSCLLESPCLV